MHEFSSNKAHRKWVIIIITVVSLVVNAFLSPYLDKLSELILNCWGIKVYPLIVLFSVGFSTLFGLLYFLFNRYVWKIIPGMKQQKISGTYLCTGRSTYKNNPDWHAEITIRQTWSHILISLKTEKCPGKTFFGGFLRDGVLWG